ncbi:MAG: DEAD/DEAH box helicase [Methanobacteriota archaeon]|nr:MAG: DEAD/DEAH box helicase [Euryarchaeota archaeon]
MPSSRVGSAFRSSSKIEALLEDLWRAQQDEPGCKAIVFSQFVSMLDLIAHRLTQAGVRCVKMDGGMSVAARDRVIAAFRDDPHVTVFLISLKAGGVALNLTAASRIYLMDPWWNPAAEFQALDRTHRLGQHRSITAVRFIVRNTVEERILALQEKKRLVFEGTIGQDNGAMARLTEEDMRFLFTH